MVTTSPAAIFADLDNLNELAEWLAHQVLDPFAGGALMFRVIVTGPDDNIVLHERLTASWADYEVPGSLRFLAVLLTLGLEGTVILNVTGEEDDEGAFPIAVYGWMLDTEFDEGMVAMSRDELIDYAEDTDDDDLDAGPPEGLDLTYEQAKHIPLPDEDGPPEAE